MAKSLSSSGDSDETRRTWEVCFSEIEWSRGGELESTPFPTNGWSGTGWV